MNSVIGIAVKDIKQFFREKGTIFWTIAFPVMILLLFTAIFGREIPFNANIGIVNEDFQTPITEGIISGLNNTGFLNVRNFTDRAEAEKELNATNIRAVLIIPQNFTQNLTLSGHANITLILDKTNLDVARLISDGVATFLKEYYKKYINRTYTEPIGVEEEAIFGKEIGYKENIVPGMLTYPLLFSSMVVSTGAIVYERERGTLKKIRASPIRPINMLFGKTLAALFQTTISILVMAILAAFLLGPKLNWNIPLLLPIFFLGSMNGIALGLIISCIGRSPQEASNAATTIAIVLQFFVGMYFPLEYLPTYLQQIGQFIPMTYAAQALRNIMIRNAVLADLTFTIAMLSLSAIALYVVGILLYKRWVEKE
ncbi:MAG: ABC transporter permease [Candidatus Bathyarchaeota archaeon]|jgi:ABC-2 type transport system permease protein|nr:ABC transporter permease [Candidatus Bathyarchaeota archaeon A05DMB-5]MDH7558562.1 ABC transporter permease [Candidatus Bathyarchaeota archaeon]